MFGKLQSSQKKYSSYKWITNQESTSGGKLEVHDVRRVFDSISSRDSDSECNLISIFGRARQGKSFLMNCLAGHEDIFRISNEKESCTQGIEISDLWLPIKDFSRSDGGKPVNGNTKIGFVDAEGQGDKDVSYDASLICPILLASKCVIFNWKGDLQKDNILSILGIMTQAAKNIKEEVSRSDLKGSASTAAQSKKFGHLHIIFRDWQAASSDVKSTFDLLFNMEEGEAAIVRNQIRQDVLASFESVKVWLFEAPMKMVSDLRKVLKFTDTTAKFKSQIRELRATLSTQLMKPTVCSGMTLTAKIFPPFIEEIVLALNTSGAVMPSSAFLTMLRAKMSDFRQKHENEIKQCVERVLATIDEDADSEAGRSYPTEEEALKILADGLDNIQRSFDDDIEQHFVTMGGELVGQVTADYPHQMKVVREEHEHQFLMAFKNKYSQWLIESRKAAEAWLDDEFQAIEHSPPVAESELLEKLNDLLVKAVNKVGGYQHEENIHVKDSIDLLRRYHKMLLDRILTINQEKLSLEGEKAIALLKKYIETMRKEISATVTRFSKEAPTGYGIKVLEGTLDKIFFELDGSLKEESSGLSDLSTGCLKHDFYESCKKLIVEMKKEYDVAKSTAFRCALQSAMFEFYNKAKLLIQLDVKQALPDLQDYLRLSAAEKIEEVSGWCAATLEDFRNQINEVVKETLKPFVLVDRAVDTLSVELEDIKRSENFLTSIKRHVDQIYNDTERKFSFVNAPYNVSDASMFKSYLKKQLDYVAQSYTAAAEQLQENLRKLRIQEEEQRQQQEQERERQRQEQERLKREQREREQRERDSANVQVDSEVDVDTVIMGEDDDQSNISPQSNRGKTGGDAIQRAIEEARLAERKRTEEAIERTKARGDIPKNRRASKIATPKKTVDQQRVDAVKYAKKKFGVSTTPPLSEDEKQPRSSRRQSTGAVPAPQPRTPPMASDSDEDTLPSVVTKMPDKKKRRASAAGFLPASDLPPPEVKGQQGKVTDASSSAKNDPVAAAREEARRLEEERIQQYLDAKKSKGGKK
eukprot:gene23582-30580_t